MLRPPPEEFEHWGRSPWIGAEVVVTKKGHPLKGQKAIVRDVLPGQYTASGLKVGIRVEAEDPSRTNPGAIFIDYDDLVEYTYVFWDNVPSRS